MEWAATAATALVAVEVSFRMIGDDLPFGTGLAVLVLTPEFFAPFRRLAVEYHAGQAGRRRARARSTSRGPARRRSVGRRSPSPAPGPGPPSPPAVVRAPALRFDDVALPLPRAPTAAPSTASTSASSRGRRSRWSGRAVPARRRSPVCCCASWSPTGAPSLVDGRPLDGHRRGRVAPLGRLGAAGPDHHRRHGRRQHPPRRTRRRRSTGCVAAADAARAHGLRRATCPTGFDTVLGRGRACSSAGASASASPSPGPRCATRRWSSSTSSPPTSTTTLEEEVRAAMGDAAERAHRAGGRPPARHRGDGATAPCASTGSGGRRRRPGRRPVGPPGMTGTAAAARPGSASPAGGVRARCGGGSSPRALLSAVTFAAGIGL